ncbi:MAG: ATP-binding cassette domain-containing protein [Deltaproteobacteria bacterium]|nr:MAG: ATP-binding cassette domain-containing protein [Deltaproteobacteria bacterium]
MARSDDPLLRLRDLRITLPDGRPLLGGVDLTVSRGEVVAILGGSGAGKSTLGRVLFEPETLVRQGFTVAWAAREMAPAAFVPQQGAPLDHLDVAGNVRLALRFRGESPAGRREAEAWIAQVGLPEHLAIPGHSTHGLSGGQAQRLAVARGLAAGRDLLFLDEPSAGLDAASSLEIARLLRAQAQERGAGIVVVTHDTLLASQAADRILFLSGEGTLREVQVPSGDREALEARLRHLLEAPAAPVTEASPRRRLGPALLEVWNRTLGPLEMPLRLLESLLHLRLRELSESARVLRRVLVQAALRPAAFYGVVSTLLGFTVLYVLVRAAPAGLSSARLLELVGGSYVLALAPPLSALLFVATSGSAVNAWLGSLALGRQLTALRAIGVPPERYLWIPAFFGLVAAYLFAATLFAAGLVAGGALLHHLEGAGPGAIARIAGDLLDPVPERVTLRARALWLLFLYAPGIACDVVWRGTDLKQRSDDVTRAMTGGVIAATLWVVALELVSALILFSTRGAG